MFHFLLSVLVWTLLLNAISAQLTPRDQSLPYLNSSLAAKNRAADLLQRMTWEEKIGQLGGVRRAFSRVNGKPSFNQTSYDLIQKTQNGQIGACRLQPLL